MNGGCRGSRHADYYLNEGREFRFGQNAKAATVNHMSIAYAEIDGEPARLLRRVI